MSNSASRAIFFLVVAVITILAGLHAWQRSRPTQLPAGFVAGNGRIEGTEIDIATRSAGRIKEILVKEGDLVGAGQIVARMDTQPLEAERDQLQAKVDQDELSTEAAIAAMAKIKADIADATLKAPRAGRVEKQTAKPGEVLPAGGEILTIVDRSDVYMAFFLPASVADKTLVGAEVRLVLDTVPQFVIPARVSLVDHAALLTPKAVETSSERRKPVFRSSVQIDPELLRKYKTHFRIELPGVAYVRLDAAAPWPENLQVKLPR